MVFFKKNFYLRQNLIQIYTMPQNPPSKAHGFKQISKYEKKMPPPPTAKSCVRP